MYGFRTIRQTAALGIINENYLRKMREDGCLPGFKIGPRFMVDVDRLIDQLRGQRAPEESKCDE